jgi:hypothetical protein
LKSIITSCQTIRSSFDISIAVLENLPPVFLAHLDSDRGRQLH